MDVSSSEIAHDHSPFLKIYKDGRIERFIGTEVVSPSLDPQTGVESKDVVISPETGVAVRIYIPKATIQTQKKLPVLVYFHGGGFCVETAFSPQYHRYLNSVVSEASVVAVSVDYRRAPEHPLPVAYDDSWAVLKWVESHADEKGPDEWLKSHADFERVFLAGDSAGANIAHHMGLRVGAEGFHADFERVFLAGDSAGANIAHHMGLRVGAEGLHAGVKLEGIVLVHPKLWGQEPVGNETARAEKKAKIEDLWRFVYPATSGSDDPYINPASDPKLGSLGTGKVLICVAEKDLYKDRGWYYREILGKSG
ncbi:hypothetical protein CIPAW_05G052700 [Carya illinoinensis]|uniref:Alpha/beta hydrolase fold-3 domain-containing protein n=1 Tax=Carya illinoinensis TaxID=32201 RepID=A0A8T1QFH1_CARIL|nr:hypothetical protein CIPAW_05G052700 [Carya illinoinensis]